MYSRPPQPQLVPACFSIQGDCLLANIVELCGWDEMRRPSFTVTWLSGWVDTNCRVFENMYLVTSKGWPG